MTVQGYDTYICHYNINLEENNYNVYDKFFKKPTMFDISKFWIYKIRSYSMKARKITNEHEQ